MCSDGFESDALAGQSVLPFADIRRVSTLALAVPLCDAKSIYIYVWFAVDSVQLKCTLAKLLICAEDSRSGADTYKLALIGHLQQGVMQR